MTFEQAKVVMGTVYSANHTDTEIAQALRVMFENRYVLYSNDKIHELMTAKAKLDAIQDRAKKFFEIKGES